MIRLCLIESSLEKSNLDYLTSLNLLEVVCDVNYGEYSSYRAILVKNIDYFNNCSLLDY